MANSNPLAPSAAIVPASQAGVAPVTRGTPPNWTAPRHGWAGGPNGMNSYYGQQPGQPTAIPTEEMAVRPVAPNWDTGPQFRPQFPETLTGDYGTSIDPFLVDGARLLQSWATDLDDTTLMSEAPDYPMVGTIASLRQVIESVYTLGVHDETVTVGVNVPATTDFVATFANGAGPSIGIRLDWFVTQLSYGPFDLNIQTSGWLAGYTSLASGAGAPAGTQPSANRSLILRARGGVNGGSLFIPWAVRAGQGMNYAMHSMAYAPAPGEGAAPFIKVAGLPAGMVGAFGFNVRLLTAFSPNTAYMSRLYQAFGQ